MLNNAIDVGFVSVSCDAIVTLCEEAFKVFVVDLAPMAGFGHGHQYIWQRSDMVLRWWKIV